MTNFKKGFTLIELLVVIAIIGILSSIVLASLSSARTKGEDAAIQANLANMRAQAELYYSNNNDYGPTVGAGTTCGGIFASTATGGLKNLVDAAKARSSTVTCAVTGSSSWAVSALLKSSSQHYCVDSTGAAKATTSAITSAACN
jgi:prepilin-type N-terminal cleavage/methylation domain-containing protein